MKSSCEVPAGLELAPNEPLRVLFVFAEARGSRPLGARQERRELLRLFEKEIYPTRRVVAHLLTRGVTRQRLEAQGQLRDAARQLNEVLQIELIINPDGIPPLDRPFRF